MTPSQFGAFIPWLVACRGPLSALVHPNTVEAPGEAKYKADIRDHTEMATWIGQSYPLDLTFFQPREAKSVEK